MAPRSELHELLKTLTTNVYFQPPNNLAIKYPCIVYERDTADTAYADNIPYRYTKRYTVTIIDRDPDSTIPLRVAALPTSRHSQSFTSDNLYHDVYNIFF